MKERGETHELTALVHLWRRIVGDRSFEGCGGGLGGGQILNLLLE
jgi:hypothetical protein